MGHHALVFGASGILGWSIVDQILKNYPASGVFSKVTALSNRPLSKENSLWPKKGPETPELRIVDGIDLTKGTIDEMKDVLQERVPDIQDVTHIYYFAYVFHLDFPTESAINLDMLRRGFGAAETLAPKLEYVIFPTGTKGYGIHLPHRPFEAPYKEDMCDAPQPWHDDLFYYVLRRELDRMQKGKSWKWAEVRCDMVVGFVPHSNPNNMPAVYMNFLSLYKFMHETGHPAASSKDVPFPASSGSYHTLFNDAGQDIFARFSIHLCLHPEQAGTSELYNIGDSAQGRSMADRWPFLCSLFGLEGKDPLEKSDPRYVLPVSFVAEHAGMAERLRREKGVELQGVGQGLVTERWMETFTFDHNFCLEKARATGFEDELTMEESWEMVLDRYVVAERAYCGCGEASYLEV